MASTVDPRYNESVNKWIKEAEYLFSTFKDEDLHL